jgi:hypothetical protein
VLHLLQPTGSCSLMVLKTRSASPDSVYARGCPQTSSSGEVACN